ncbi:MAG: thermonuclease family protein [Methyloligellaceae bacterium]
MKLWIERISTLMAVCGFSISVLAAEPMIIEGAARAIDGRTIEIWGQTIRLWGVSVADGDTEEGRRATLQLQRLIKNVTVRCKQTGESSLKFAVARCYVGDIDIAWPMVMTGHATDDPLLSGGHYAASR